MTHRRARVRRGRFGRASASAIVVIALLTSVPVGAESFIDRGRQEAQDEDYRKAAKWFERALEAGEGSPAAVRGALAQVYLKLGDSERASELAERAIAEAPGTLVAAAAYNTLGRVAFGAALVESAHKNEADVEAAPASPSGFELAEQHFRSGIAIAGNEWLSLHVNLAETLTQMKRFDEALKVLDESGGEDVEDAEELREQLRCFAGLVGAHGEQLPDEEEDLELTKLRPVSRPAPRYTEVARRRRIQGTVIIHSILDEEGVPRCPRVVLGLPSGLSGAALDAVRQWRFQPVRRKDTGEPVRVLYNVAVNFKLRR